MFQSPKGLLRMLLLLRRPLRVRRFNPQRGYFEFNDTDCRRKRYGFQSPKGLLRMQLTKQIQFGGLVSIPKGATSNFCALNSSRVTHLVSIPKGATSNSAVSAHPSSMNRFNPQRGYFESCGSECADKRILVSIPKGATSNMDGKKLRR